MLVLCVLAGLGIAGAVIFGARHAVNDATRHVRTGTVRHVRPGAAEPKGSTSAVRVITPAPSTAGVFVEDQQLKGQPELQRILQVTRRQVATCETGIETSGARVAACGWATDDTVGTFFGLGRDAQVNVLYSMLLQAMPYLISN